LIQKYIVIAQVLKIFYKYYTSFRSSQKIVLILTFVCFFIGLNDNNVWGSTENKELVRIFYGTGLRGYWEPCG
jgi:hypothetical protein